MPYERDLFDEPMGAGMYHKAMSLIIIAVLIGRSEAQHCRWD